MKLTREAVGWQAAGDRSGSTRAEPLQSFLVAGAAGGHRDGGAGQQLVIGQGVPRLGPCSGSWSPEQPVAIETVSWPAAGDRSGSTRAGPLQRLLVAGAAGGHRGGELASGGGAVREYQGRAPAAVPGHRRSRWPSSGGAGQQLVIGQANTRAGPLQPFLVAGAAGGHRSGELASSR